MHGARIVVPGQFTQVPQGAVVVDVGMGEAQVHAWVSVVMLKEQIAGQNIGVGQEVGATVTTAVMQVAGGGWPIVIIWASVG